MAAVPHVHCHSFLARKFPATCLGYVPPKWCKSSWQTFSTCSWWVEGRMSWFTGLSWPFNWTLLYNSPFFNTKSYDTSTKTLRFASLLLYWRCLFSVTSLITGPISISCSCSIFYSSVIILEPPTWTCPECTDGLTPTIFGDSTTVLYIHGNNSMHNHRIHGDQISLLIPWSSG